jgi:hypothetical protein
MATTAKNDDSKVSPSLELTNTTSQTDDRGQVDGLDDGYLHASKTTKFYRGVLFQMILFGA